MAGSFQEVRRYLIKSLGAVSLLPVTGLEGAVAIEKGLTKTIPTSGERISAVGMGTWITFNVGKDPYLRSKRTEVLKTFFQAGGQVVDSSPMYGSSELVLGHALDRLNNAGALFSATKVWTGSVTEGKGQFNDSKMLWRLPRIDLLQVHNLVNWQEHLAVLREYQQQGQIRYLGVTTSHGRRHNELEKILQTQSIDFVQLTYNIRDREVEQRLLPLAIDNGVAVIANRPFQGGRLFQRIGIRPLPEYFQQMGCDNWAQFFLRFILAHPAVTCAIPATSQLPHMQENMGAMRLPELPGRSEQQAMQRYFEGLF